MIDLVTKVLPEIKNGVQPKIYAEMLTIQLSESGKQTALTQVPEGISDELARLQSEIKDLKNHLTNLDSSEISPKSTKRPKTNSSYRYKVDRVKILTIMEETIVDSQKSREYLEALKGAWNEILDSISAQDRALLLGSEPVLANSENAILAFDAAFNAEQAMKRTDLNDMFGNVMSKAAGFSPNILAVPRKDFNSIRAEFAQNLKKKKQNPVEEVKVGKDILRSLNLLNDKIKIVSCPTCGRCNIDLINIANEVENKIQDLDKNMTVAIMGCVVNGPGEAREADIGIAGGKGQGILFKKGEIVRKIPADKLVEELLDEIDKFEEK